MSSVIRVIAPHDNNLMDVLFNFSDKLPLKSTVIDLPMNNFKSVLMQIEEFKSWIIRHYLKKMNFASVYSANS